MAATPSRVQPGRGRRRERVVLGTIYAGVVVLVALGFLGHSLRAYHLTFSQRDFFWLGDIHRDDTMGFRMRESRDGTAVLAHGVWDPTRRIAVRTDAHGLRIPLGRDGAFDAADGIAAIGCSCTFAHGVAAESSYVEVAGRILGLPAANLGVCAYSPVTSALLLEQHIARLRPRAVVYGFANFHLERAERARADSDLFHAYARCEGGDCRILPPAFDNRRVFASAGAIEALYYRPRLAGEPTPLSPARIRALVPLAAQDLSRLLHPTSVRLRFERPALPETLFCRFILQRMYDTCRAQGAEFVLLWFPKERGERPVPGLRAAVAALESRDGFTFVDCSAPLFAATRDQADYAARWQVPRDGHPNRFMHAVMGQAVAAALEPRLAPAIHSPGARIPP